MGEIEVYVQVLRFLAYGITIVSFVFMVFCKYKDNFLFQLQKTIKDFIEIYFSALHMILFIAQNKQQVAIGIK